MANKRVGDEKGRDRPRDPAAREVRKHEPPLDQLRIEVVRAALARGEYVVDPRRIAEKLLQYERGLPR